MPASERRPGLCLHRLRVLLAPPWLPQSPGPGGGGRPWEGERNWGKGRGRGLSVGRWDQALRRVLRSPQGWNLCRQDQEGLEGLLGGGLQWERLRRGLGRLWP